VSPSYAVPPSAVERLSGRFSRRSFDGRLWAEPDESDKNVPMPDQPVSGGRYVIHEHYASTHHFDLRLEREGTLWSWALPKGMPTDPAADRLAVRVEDHDLDHIDFEDTTSVSDAPGGTIVKSIWDHGTYIDVRTTDDKLVIDLVGERLNNRFAIFRTSGPNWIAHLMIER
jgi:bifunctional non-homologous end joining protein LigD